MPPKLCFAADSAGVVLTGDTAVLTFMSTGVFDRPHDAVLLSRDTLVELYQSIAAELDRMPRDQTASAATPCRSDIVRPSGPILAS